MMAATTEPVLHDGETSTRDVIHACCPCCYRDAKVGDPVRRLCGLRNTLKSPPLDHTPSNACVVCMMLDGCDVCGTSLGNP